MTFAGNAPHDTRLGRLQRGRGAGFLDALDQPRAARDEVVRCVIEDPRVDWQVESRGTYYASLALRIDAPLAPLVEHLEAWEDDPDITTTALCLDVLARAWRRGSEAARRLPWRLDPASRASIEFVAAVKWLPMATSDGLVPAAVAAHAADLAEGHALSEDRAGRAPLRWVNLSAKCSPYTRDRRRASRRRSRGRNTS